MKAILIIWPRAQEILPDAELYIKKSFTIKSKHKLNITSQNVGELLSSLYDVKKVYLDSKQNAIGLGIATVFIIEDSNPSMNIEETMSGLQYLNSNFFDLKQHLRNLKGSFSQIHVTNNELEYNKHNLIIDSLLANNYSKKIDFSSLHNLFEYINDKVAYVILRKSDLIESEDSTILNGKEDIDVLVSDKEKFISLVSGCKVYRNSYDNRYSVKISGEDVLFDINTVNDYDLDPLWQINLLKRREKGELCYTPNLEDHFYAYLYHLLIHKQSNSKSDLNYLLELFEKLKVKKNLYTTDFNLNELLRNYMMINGYSSFRARNLKVYYNLTIAKKIGIHRPLIYRNLPTSASHLKKMVKSYYCYFRFIIRDVKSYVLSFKIL